MTRLLLLLSIVTALLAPTALRAAEAPGLRFASVAFHDVVDAAADLDSDAVTTDHLIAFFEWLRADGWTAISLDDVTAAQAGTRPLPAKAMLVTFDDGYRSLYTRVWPLARAYRVPIVAALVGSWLDVPAGGLVDYGGEKLPREHFISWDEARAMQRSGLIEFASHSYNLHKGVIGNPQGNTMPAAVTARFDPIAGYETEDQTKNRLRADLQRSHAQLERELGRAPRAVVWPFGRYSRAAQNAAAEAGFKFALTLEPEPASAARPMALARFLPTENPRVGVFSEALRFGDRLPSAQRLVCVNPAELWHADPAVADEQLGHAIERVRALGATAVVLDAVHRRPDGSLSAWFPTSALPVEADVLARLSWQMQTRAGVDSFVRLPNIEALPEIVADLARKVPASGLLIDEPGLAGLEPMPGSALPTLRERRAAFDPTGLSAAAARSWQAYQTAKLHRPGLQLAVLQASAPTVDNAEWAPNPLADLTLRPTAPPGTGAIPSASRRRVGLWLEAAAPPQPAPLVRQLRDFQQRGGTIFGWCPDHMLSDLPPVQQVAPDASASTFPIKF